MSKTYNPGKIKPMVQVVAGILENDPSLHQDHDRLLATVYVNIPELKDKARCANCSASMVQYEYKIDVLDVALVIGMAQEAKRRVSDGMSFTEANKVHVPTLDVSDAVRHRTTKCSKLGLIAKYREQGKQLKGTWVITKRGFEALKGKEVPTGTIVWRGNIIDRPDTTTTFESVRTSYTRRVADYERKHRKAPKDDHRDAMGTYNPLEWVDFAGYHDGDLF
jgi:hypothetical protein